MMKKSVMVFALALMMIFVSCNGSPSAPEENPPSEEVPSTPVEPETPEEPEIPAEPSFGTPTIGLNGWVNHGDYATAALSMASDWYSAKIIYTVDGSIPSETNGMDFRMNNHSVVCRSKTGMQYVSSGVEVMPNSTVKAIAIYVGSYSDVVSFVVPDAPGYALQKY